MANKKNPQNANQDLAQQELESMKRELMQAGSSLKQMKDRLDRMESERDKLVEENLELKKKTDGEKDGLVDLIEFHKKEKEELHQEKQRLEFEYTVLKRKMDEVDENYAKLLDLKAKDAELERQVLVDKIKQLEVRLEKIDHFLGKQSELENERKSLSEALDKERREKIRELADKDREKVQATDMLKKDMLHKIQDTKQSLLALKKEQLETTTRLTVLQNHQLTTELEYQSKQTEKLLFKNSKLTEQVISLKRDIEIHKQVEQELAKRSHFAQKLIKKLTGRIKELEDSQEQDAVELPSSPNIQQSEDKNKEGEIKIAQLDRKLAKLQNDNDILRNENNHLQTKLEVQKGDDSKFQNLANLLAGNLEILKNQPGDEFTLDLQEIREKQVTDWSATQKQAVLNILLSQVSQMLTKRYLNYTDEKVTVSLLDNSKSINLPKISQQEEDTNAASKRFQGVPLDISTQIVRSNLREWGKPSQSLPNHNLTRKIKLK